MDLSVKYSPPLRGLSAVLYMEDDMCLIFAKQLKSPLAIWCNIYKVQAIFSVL